MITWLFPAVTGNQTSVLYDVDCKKSCEYYGTDMRGRNMWQRSYLHAGSLKYDPGGSNKSELLCKLHVQNRRQEQSERGG